MSSRSKWAAIIAGSLVAVTAAVGWWSVNSIHWQGRMPTGEWTILVRDGSGQPVVNAAVTMISVTSSPLAYETDSDGRAKGRFDNYTGPGSVTSGSDGSIHLRSTRGGWIGGEGREIFWCCRSGEWPDDPTPDVLWLTAPGYDATTVSINTLYSEGEMTVTLLRNRGNMGTLPMF